MISARRVPRVIMESSRLMEKDHMAHLLEKDSIVRRVFGWYWPTSEKECFEAESKILSLANVHIERRLVNVNGAKINTLEMGSHFTEPEKVHLNKVMVMTPGFGAAVGLFYKNFEAFAQHPGLKVYAVDWLGTGRSSRVDFDIKPGKEGSVEAAENFFIDNLEEWRKEVGIDKMILFGHSLGGYLSACYAMKYPERVEHLFLVSPAGIPAAPAMTEEEKRVMKENRPFIWNVVTYLWERSYTPQGLIRALGHFGPNLVKFYTDRRFDLQGEEADVFRSYSYHINARPGSGEYGLHCILGVGAWARNPLISRVHKIRAPTTFLYGSHDWMDPNAGRAASARMNVPTSVRTVSHSDHHLYIDNPPEFNHEVLKVIRSIQATAAARAK